MPTSDEATISVEWIVGGLTSGRGTSKEAAIRAITSLCAATTPSARNDVATLRGRIIQALKTRFVPAPPDAEDLNKRDTRCWLLSALGRVAEDDKEAAALVRAHLRSDYEPYVWSRYWAFEGLVAGKAGDLGELARALTEESVSPVDDPHLQGLIPSLATVVLADGGDRTALAIVEKKLAGTSDEKWAMLRALRVVPLTKGRTVELIRGLVRDGGYSDVTFDAIVALGRLPKESEHADGASQTLAAFLVEYRWPMYDSMRAKALIGLGKLSVERTAQVLIEELSDDSPAILYAAARALEQVLGLPRATARVVEAASRAERSRLARFADALRSMDRDAVVGQLETEMLSGPEDRRSIAQALLSEIGGVRAFQRLKARTDAMNQYLGALEHAERKVRRLFQETLEDARRGFQLASAMDVAVFGVGLLFVIFGAYLAGVSHKEWTALFTGAAGVAGTVYGVFVAKPRERVREAVDHLMNLKLVFLAYLRQLHQVDQAYTRKILEKGTVEAGELKEFSLLINQVMREALGELDGKRRVKPAAIEPPSI